jgi:hypothetical protein
MRFHKKAPPGLLAGGLNRLGASLTWLAMVDDERALSEALGFLQTFEFERLQVRLCKILHNQVAAEICKQRTVS